MTARKSEVGVKEGADRTDVFPVPLENVGTHFGGMNLLWNDMLTKVYVRIVERSNDRRSVEHINPHGGLVQLGVCGLAHFFQKLRPHTQSVQNRGVLGLFHKLVNPAVGIGAHDPELGGVLPRNRRGGDGDVRAAFDMLGKDVSEIHPVQLVSREDDKVVVRSI